MWPGVNDVYKYIRSVAAICGGHLKQGTEETTRNIARAVGGFKCPFLHGLSGHLQGIHDSQPIPPIISNRRCVWYVRWSVPHWMGYAVILLLCTSYPQPRAKNRDH
jgi:hypothetical protein